MASARLRVAKRFAAIAVVFTACLAFGCQGQKQTQPAGQAAIEVAVVAVASRPVELTTDLPGRTAAYQVAEIRPQVNGIIQECLFREGSDVKAGQRLHQIDPAPFQVAYVSAKASLAKAEANLPSVRSRAGRYRQLLTENAVSRQDSEDADAALAQAEADIAYWKAAVEAARINLAYTSITAPFDGRIGKTSVKTGSLVTAYQPAPLAVLQRLDPIYVDVVQSSAEWLRLRRSLETGQLRQDRQQRQKVQIFLEDGTPYALEGTLQFADVSVDPTTGSYTLRIVVPNPDHLLLPGMFVRAVVREGVATQAILVPQQGVGRNPKGEAVALVLDAADTVQQRVLRLDRAIGDQWLVSAGLAAGERLIVEGLLNIRPGMTVKAVTMDLDAAPKKAAGQASAQL
jgi:membrane fusion protein (multidrug efflux system)